MREKSKESRVGAGLFLAGFILILAAVVLLLIYNMRGEEKTIGEFSEPKKTVSVICTSKVTSHPLLKAHDETKKEMTIKIVANEEYIDTISLIDELYYKDKEGAISGRDWAHRDLNEKFGEDGLVADSFNATYSLFENKFQLSLFVSPEELNNKALKYFLLDDLGVKNKYKYADAITLYNKQGFECKENV